MKNKDDTDDIKVTITYRGRSVTTTAGKVKRLANSPKLIKKLARQARKSRPEGTI